MIELLLAACLLVLALIAGLLFAIQDRVRRGLRDLRVRSMSGPEQEQWRQTSSLIALYRILDGKEWLPTMRGMELSPDLLLHIALHIQRERPRVIIECGCGASTIVMAHAIEKAGGQGHIYSVEEHPAVAEETSRELARRGIDRLVSINIAPLTEHRYARFDTPFQWYDLSAAALPAQADMLLVGGPRNCLNKFARYPAGPEFLPRLAPGGHVFVSDANELDQIDLRQQWRVLYPDLGIRNLGAENGAFEMYFLNHKIQSFVRDKARSTDAA
jgi:hypothetical protein